MNDYIIAILAALTCVIAWTVGAATISRWRYFRRLKANGVSLEYVAARERVGTLVYDSVYGASIGIGSPVVWFLEGLSSIDQVETTTLAGAPLVDLPIHLRSVAALQAIGPHLQVCDRVAIVDYGIV